MSRTIAKLAAALIVVTALVDPNLSLATDYYIKPAQVDLIHILAPPPAPESAAGRADLQSVLEAQHRRTPAEIKVARADEERSVFRFATVLGPAFKPENLPFATQFFERAFANDEYVIAPVKSHFDRPRPFLADHKVKPVVDATMTDARIRAAIRHSRTRRRSCWPIWCPRRRRRFSRARINTQRTG
jgi:acid phosphatase (class A)